jgi:hypothetical protein
MLLLSSRKDLVMKYETWLVKFDASVEALTDGEIGYDDLPDTLDAYEAYEGGMTPLEAARFFLADAGFYVVISS